MVESIQKRIPGHMEMVPPATGASAHCIFTFTFSNLVENKRKLLCQFVVRIKKALENCLLQ